MLELKNISKSYGTFSISEVSLKINSGEYFVILGRSGAGKSQLLELIAGLKKPDKGSIWLEGKDITHEKIQKRRAGMVFQDFAIFPHMTVYDNIAYPLRIKRQPRKLVDDLVKEIAASVNITHLLNRKTPDLSGGERQRVAVARTLVNSPAIILLDEPMASIDTPLRDDVRKLLRKINSMGITILHVTHDYREAIRLADRIGIIHNGRLLQAGTPDEVFSRPVNKFVARFAGIRNFYRVKILDKDGKTYADSGNCKYILPPGDYPADGLLLIKSNEVKLFESEQNGHKNCHRGRILEINRAEYGFELFIDSGDQYHVQLSEKEMQSMSLKAGHFVFLCFPADELKII